MDNKIILAVDDSAVGLRSVKTILEDRYTIRVAKTTGLASLALKNEHIDLILLDIEMPGDMSGIDYLKELKQDPATKDIPVIMVTGHTAFKLITEATKNGATDYVVKPIDPAMLHEKVLAVFQ
ncbi:MAG: hypothetical protein Ta2G_11180 [Termitinemataceae bacterium]|nr:MAG: hypothetical protein Ta2G_11180 [Termitinemataceae bacterium]